MTAAEPLIEVELPAPVEEVWAHLRDPGFIRRWFGWEYEGLEGEIEFIVLGPPPEALAGMPEGAGFDVDDGPTPSPGRTGASTGTGSSSAPKATPVCCG